jgi:crotonobetainyl-CoA:carnitine CoA-transferase CaiB-like acyl-CoA transferase
MCDVYDDPQLKQRPQWIEIEHPEIGKMHYQRPPFLLTKTPPGPQKRDPLLAEHNEYFYRELLGLSEEEYKKLVDEQVIY